ncbi:uncharacterized protein EAF02_003474 [Botrytis sinoallii]|uniref:uncharacterized protein n=1 Tax=Botrytis sinoallii TaxID=1463999 RepID=UPI0019021911|nr:uncharacterized protein EAF02_003474 [Botrytis sinoallii]KAF7886827.1 hypothetical protein EAF02_003474 [Botrytis sinoallii]
MFGDQIDFSFIKPKWEYNKDIDLSRTAKIKESLFKIARNVNSDLSISSSYYIPYKIVIVSYTGFLEILLEAELGKASVYPFTNCFHNVTLKSFSFETIKGPGGVRYELTETKESKMRKYSRSRIALG